MKTIYYFLIILLFANCSTKQKEQIINEIDNANNVELSEAQLINANIKIGNAETKKLSYAIHVNGTIDVPPQNLVTVSFPLGGYLKSTNLLPGMKIKKGEVIAVIEHPDFIQMQENFLTSKVQVEVLQKEYDRLKQLNETKATSDKSLEQAYADLKNEKIKLSANAEKLKLINVNPDALNEHTLSRNVSVVAPITGYVSAVNVNIGKYLNPSDVLFELVNPDDLHLSLTVFEKDMVSLQIGQKVIAYMNGYEDKKYDADIILIGKKLDNSRSVEVHCHFKSNFDDLLPGMFMNADIEIVNKNCIIVPDDAIVVKEGKSYIFKALSHNKFEFIEIEPGIVQNGFTEIKSTQIDLSTIKIVTKNAYTLFMKMENKSEEE